MKDLVSVVMCVHNEPTEYIDLATNSICQQSYRNIEFIIIDDASNDFTSSHLKELCNRYPIIRLYRNESNLGLTSSLNKGFALSKGVFIARMDADDYSCPTRIERQYEYFKSHPDVGIIGTGVVSFGQETKFMSPVKGSSYKDVQSNLFFQSSLCHPSVMIRKEFLTNHNLSYDENVKKGQDYDLWERASVYGKLIVMPDVLLYYRTHEKQITSTSREEQDKTLKKVILRRLQRIGIEPNEQEINCHFALLGQVNSSTISEIEKWINKLVDYSNTYNFIDTPNFSANLMQRYVLTKIKRHIMPNYKEWGVALRILLQRIHLKNKLNILRKEINSNIDV